MPFRIALPFSPLPLLLPFHLSLPDRQKKQRNNLLFIFIDYLSLYSVVCLSGVIQARLSESSEWTCPGCTLLMDQGDSQ